MDRFEDNNKLIGMTFDFACGCTIKIEDIVAEINLRNRSQSQILLKLEVEKHCDKNHRKDIEGDTYYEEFDNFMNKMYSSWSETPKVNTIRTITNKSNDKE